MVTCAPCQPVLKVFLRRIKILPADAVSDLLVLLSCVAVELLHPSMEESSVLICRLLAGGDIVLCRRGATAVSLGKFLSATYLDVNAVSVLVLSFDWNY